MDNKKNIHDFIEQGNRLMTLEKYEEAIECYDKCIELLSNNSISENYILDVYLLKANAIERLCKYKEAIDYYNKVIEKDKTNTNAYIGKGRVLYTLEKYEEALKCFDKLESTKKDNINAYLYKAILFETIKEYEKALDYYDKLLIIDETNINAYLGKGRVYEAIKEYEKAIFCYDNILPINTNIIITTYLHKAYALGMLKMFNEAIEYYDKAIEINKECIHAYLCKGYILMVLKTYEEAIKCFNEALKINPNDININILNGYTLSYMDKNQEAKKSFNRVLEIDKKNIKALLGNAQILYNSNEYDKLVDNYCDIINITDKYYNMYSPILKSFFEHNKIKNESNKNDKLIYHYGNIYSLEGILKGKEFWVTKSNFLNDISDTSYITKVLKKMIVDIDKQDKNVNTILEDISDYMSMICGKEKTNKDKDKDIIDFINNNLNNDTYILSMTEEEDSLPLWGNYSREDGYNIGFNKDKLVNTFNNLYESESYSTFYNGKVFYDGKDDIKKIYDIIRKNYFEIKKRGVDEKKIICAILSNLRVISLFIKHKGFAYENEYRFAFIFRKDINDNEENESKISIYQNANILGKDESKIPIYQKVNMDCRVSNGTLIPYIKLPICNIECLQEENSKKELDKGLIERITISPINKIDTVREGLKCFLNQQHISLKEKNIKNSEIPIRFL